VTGGASSRYRRPEDYRHHARAVLDRVGRRAEVTTIGHSVERRPLRSITVAGPGRTPDRERPLAMVIATIHGCEVVASELALRLLELACVDEPSGPVGELLEVADLRVVPVVNPDGRARALASLDEGGLLRPAPRRNASGVDLNRNWPFPEGVRDHWLPIAGTRLRSLPWYRGPAPLSEPETRAVAELVESRPPFALLNLHSTGQIVTYPWSSKEEAPADLTGFEAMIAAFVAHQPTWPYRSKQSRAWYPIVGSSNDWFYDRHRVMALTVETGVPGGGVKRDPRKARYFFWWANPTDLEHHVANDAEACFAALVAAHAYRFPGG